MTTHFDSEAVSTAARDLVIGVRSGHTHRYTPLWAVVVDGRIFVRSWALSGGGWHEAFSADAHGDVQIGGREFPVQAVLIGDKRLLDRIDAAYAAKYHTPASLQYVRDLQSDRSRATTTELVPDDSATA